MLEFYNIENLNGKKAVIEIENLYGNKLEEWLEIHTKVYACDDNYNIEYFRNLPVFYKPNPLIINHTTFVDELGQYVYPVDPANAVKGVDYAMTEYEFIFNVFKYDPAKFPLLLASGIERAVLLQRLD